MIRQQILRARKPKRDDLLFREQDNEKARERKLVLNLTYHPAFAKIKNILKNIHVLLAGANEEHRKVFSDMPIVGFKRGKSLKDYLVRSKLPVQREKVGQSEARNFFSYMDGSIFDGRKYLNPMVGSSLDGRKYLKL